MTGGRHRVVVVGAGFGGIHVVRGLREADVDVLLVDRHNHHLFQPLLYQVATALLDPSEIARPIRSLVRRQRNCDVLLAHVEAIDLEQRRLLTGAGPVPYDTLVVATGSVTDSLGKPGVAEHAFGLKSLDDAIALRNHILSTVEAAATAHDDAERRRLLTVAVVGAGPTGVECAGAVSELVGLVLRKDFPRLDLGALRIVLIEATDTVLASFAPRLRSAAIRTLRRKGVELRLGAQVDDVDDRAVILADGERIEAGTVIWTVGVRGAPTGGLLAGRRGRQGRIPVGEDLRLAGHPEVFVIGDVAAPGGGEALPMLAPVAIQQGGWVAKVIAAERGGGPAPGPFHYLDKGTMATIGRNSAVAQIGPVHVAGFAGWLMWLGVHLVQIVSFRSKAIVLINWGWDYVFYDRPVRLITAPERAGLEGSARREQG